nr:hypothetical protein [Tanacetum cinerariifolium]
MDGFKGCSSCGALYTKSCACSKGGFIGKFVRDPNKTTNSSQRPPHDCPKCGNPVDGLYCCHCAILRKKLKNVWFIISDEHKFFKDFVNTSKSSHDNSNVVNAPQDDIFCQRCTCKSYGNGAHYGYNYPPKVSIFSNLEPCHNQNVEEFPQTLPSFHPRCYSGDENSFAYDSTLDFVNDSSNIPICYDDDDDEESSIPLRDIIIFKLPLCIAITLVLSTKETKNSLIIWDKHLDTIPKNESDEFIKSSVENLVPNPMMTSHLIDEDIPKEICSNPFFDEEIISIKIDPHHFSVESDLIESLLNQDSSIISSSTIDSLLDEFAGELIFLKSIPSGIDEAYCDLEEEIRLIEKLLYDNLSPRPPKEINSENSDAIIESFSPSPIPFEDSDPFM